MTDLSEVMRLTWTLYIMLLLSLRSSDANKELSTRVCTQSTQAIYLTGDGIWPDVGEESGSKFKGTRLCFELFKNEVQILARERTLMSMENKDDMQKRKIIATCLSFTGQKCRLKPPKLKLYKSPTAQSYACIPRRNILSHRVQWNLFAGM